MHPRDIVAGRFEIDRLAGSGGMGEVYRAIDRQTGQIVALKVLHGHSGEHADRFAREARLLSELRHPGIVRFVGSGATDRGDGFIVMEWLEGESLSARLKRGPLSPADVVALGARVADALRVAHERGIIHRDLKPANLFLEGGALERLKVLDFGIARILDPGQKLTMTGAMLGTLGYMSPEQARGDKEVDARTDVYALGCVMFRALTGRRVFTGDDAVSVLIRVAMEPAPRASGMCPGLPPALDDLLARMLATSPADRPRDASALLAELAVIGGWQQGATALHPPSSRGAGPPSALAPPSSFSPAPSSGGPSGFAALPPSSFSPAPPPAPAPRPAPPPQGPLAATWTSGAPGVAPTYVNSAAPAHTVGSFPGVPVATQPAPAPPSRAPVLLLAGAVGALLVVVLLLGAVALFVLGSGLGGTGGATAPTSGCPGQRCVPSKLRDPARVDAVAELPQVRDFARSIDSGAKLVLINITTTSSDGTVNVKDSRHVVQFHFQHPDKDVRFFIWLTGTQLAYYPMQAIAGAVPVSDPGCAVTAVWKTAVPPGAPPSAMSSLQLLDAGPPLGPIWQVSSGKTLAYVDPRSCAVKRLY